MILAIDPGTQKNAAYAIGPLGTPTTGTFDLTSWGGMLPFYAVLWDRLTAIPADDVTLVLVEGASFGNHAKHRGGVASLESVRAVVKLAAASHFCCPCITVPPSTLKLHGAGHGHASKEDMVAAAFGYGYTGSNEDEADAFLLHRYAGNDTLPDRTTPGPAAYIGKTAWWWWQDTTRNPARVCEADRPLLKKLQKQHAKTKTTTPPLWQP